MEFLLVGVGGALGAILRYLLGLLPYQGSFPLKTWAINLVGSFLIGWLSALRASCLVSGRSAATYHRSMRWLYHLLHLQLGESQAPAGGPLSPSPALYGQQPSPRLSLCRSGLLLRPRQPIKYQKAGS